MSIRRDWVGARRAHIGAYATDERRRQARRGARRATGGISRCALVSIATALASLATSSPARAQQATLRLETDRRQLAPGEMLEIKVTISVEGSTSLGDYTPPPLPGFRAAGRTMQSRGIRVDPFTMRSEVTAVYVYTARATQPGRFKIGPASVTLGGRRFLSNTLEVTVQGTQNARPSTRQPANRQPPNLDSEETAPSLFIDATTSPRIAYVGQQVLAEWRLYTQISVRPPDIVREPQSDGFWSEDLATRRLRQLTPQTVQGRAYHSGTVLRKVLYPQRSGTLQLGELEVVIEVPSNSLLFDPTVRRKSRPVTVEVLPLPKNGQPADFPAQNVGTFDITATLDRNEVEVGQAVKLTVAVGGVGNTRQLTLPELPRLTGLKLYEPKITDGPPSSVDLSSKKRAEHLIVPTRPGLVRIPPLVLDFFDPHTKTYRQARTKELALRVSGKAAAAASSESSGRSATNVIGPDIRPPRPASPLEHRSPSPPIGPLNLALLALPLAGLLLLLGRERLRDRISRPTARSRERAAARLVREQLALAARQKDSADSSTFFATLTAAVNGQLRHQMQRPVEGMTRAELEQAMKEAGFDNELALAVVAQLARLEAERFAPAAADTTQRNDQVLSETRQLVRRVAGASLGRHRRTTESS